MELHPESIRRLWRSLRHVENRLANLPAYILRYAQSVGDDGQTVLTQLTGSSGWTGSGGTPDGHNNYMAYMFGIDPTFANTQLVPIWVRSPNGDELGYNQWYIARRVTYNPADGKPVYVVTPIPAGVDQNIVTNVCPIKSGGPYVTDINVESTIFTLPFGTVIASPICTTSPTNCCGTSGSGGGDTSGCPQCTAAPITWIATVSGVRDGTCSDCSLVSGPYRLHYNLSCRWFSHAGTSADIKTCLGTGAYVFWNVNLAFTGGVWQATLHWSDTFGHHGGTVCNLSGTFNCLGTNTFHGNFITMIQLGQCTGGAITIVINPA